MNICSVVGCASKVKAYGYCERHDYQIKNYGKIVAAQRSRLDKNEIVIKDDFAEIYLYNDFGDKVGVAVVDIESIGIVSEMKWHVDGYGYVKSSDGILMHRLLLCSKNKSICVDHINRNTLDNRLKNLRIATKSQNAANGGIRSSNTSGFKGVVKSGKRWRAQIKLNYKHIHIGRFDNPIDAAKAYDEACVKYHGEFGVTNSSLGLL